MAARIQSNGEIQLKFQGAKGEKVYILISREAALRHVEQVVECLERLRANDGFNRDVLEFQREKRITDCI